MTTITFTYKKNNNITSLVGIKATGHSGYAEKGSDIVCASISTLLFTMIIGLSEIESIPSFKAQINDKDDLIKASWSQKYSPRVNLLSRSIEKSLRRIAANYSDYVKITEVFI